MYFSFKKRLKILYRSKYCKLTQYKTVFSHSISNLHNTCFSTIRSKIYCRIRYHCSTETIAASYKWVHIPETLTVTSIPDAVLHAVRQVFELVITRVPRTFIRRFHRSLEHQTQVIKVFVKD